MGTLRYNEYNKYDRALKTATAEAAQLKSELGQLSGELKKKIEQIEKMETSLRLLKTDQRLARLKVLSVEKDEKTGSVNSEVSSIVELSPSGSPSLLSQNLYLARTTNLYRQLESSSLTINTSRRAMCSAELRCVYSSVSSAIK